MNSDSPAQLIEQAIEEAVEEEIAPDAEPTAAEAAKETPSSAVEIDSTGAEQESAEEADLLAKLERSKRIIEAVLFAAGKPLRARQIADAVESVDARGARRLLKQLAFEYDESERGFQIIEVQNGFQLIAREAYAPWVRRLFTKEVSAKLTPAALEALAIVAYHQPVTRAEVDEIRGVNSGSVMSSLIERNLINITGRKDAPGRPFLHGTTDRFLEHFGLKNINDLPTLEEIGEMFNPLAEDDAAADASR